VCVCDLVKTSLVKSSLKRRLQSERDSYDDDDRERKEHPLPAKSAVGPYWILARRLPGLSITWVLHSFRIPIRDLDQTSIAHDRVPSMGSA
jgi:hypothetical protein